MVKQIDSHCARKDTVHPQWPTFLHKSTNITAEFESISEKYLTLYEIPHESIISITRTDTCTGVLC